MNSIKKINNKCFAAANTFSVLTIWMSRWVKNSHERKKNFIKISHFFQFLYFAVNEAWQSKTEAKNACHYHKGRYIGIKIETIYAHSLLWLQCLPNRDVCLKFPQSTYYKNRFIAGISASNSWLFSNPQKMPKTLILLLIVQKSFIQLTSNGPLLSVQKQEQKRKELNEFNVCEVRVCCKVLLN